VEYPPGREKEIGSYRSQRKITVSSGAKLVYNLSYFRGEIKNKTHFLKGLTPKCFDEYIPFWQ
jgi:hypothetical protein